MERLLSYVDLLSEFSGKLFAWLIIILTLAIVYEVVCRYIFNAPTIWIWDFSYMLYGAHFMMGAAYTLKHNGNVRIDLFYSRLSARGQAIIDLCLYPIFFFPAVGVLFWVGWDHAQYSWQIREVSSMTMWRAPIYPLKTVLPVATGLLLLQGIAEFMRLLIKVFGKKG